jgi:hypothetical protein
MILLVVGITAANLAQQVDTAPAKSPAFAGKEVLIMSNDTNRDITLIAPEMHQAGGRAFFVGRESKTAHFTRPRFGEATIWIPVDQVTTLVVLDPLDAAK